MARFDLYEKGGSMGKKRLLGSIGSILILCAVFSPLVSTPTGVRIGFFTEYLPAGLINGSFLFVCGIVSLGLTWLGKYELLLLTGLGSLLAFADQLIEILGMMYGKMSILTLYFSWGWVLLVPGITLLIVAGLPKKAVKNNPAVVPA
jgi:hypothetical protein